MIECYFKWCPYHSTHDPFCTLGECESTDAALADYRAKRAKELGTTPGKMGQVIPITFKREGD